jgi:endoglucanase
MMPLICIRHAFRLIFPLLLMVSTIKGYSQESLSLNHQDNFETQGLNVLVFSDNYPEGHQGGIQIIQHDERVAANGDLWLEPAPGQWSPFSQINSRKVDTLNRSITVSLSYPNAKASERKFNPVSYPDLKLDYSITVKAEGSAFRITVNLSKPLPKDWAGKAGFNLELFPGGLFGKTFMMDGKSGSFPRQVSGPLYLTEDDGICAVPLAEGNRLVIAPESDRQRITIESKGSLIQLIDGRAQHNNGWFIARSLIPKGATTSAVEWFITPNVIQSPKYAPVIHINQVGYLPSQEKTALIECDKRDTLLKSIRLVRIAESGKEQVALSDTLNIWGIFQHYKYYRFNFTAVEEAGTYYVRYDTIKSSLFRIGKDIYDRNVWQPTLEYFLPVQMCHMRVNDRYKVWHGLCHMDDAEMAPTDHIHFDGYIQGSSTLTSYKPGEHVAGLNAGGWHDAGDYDLRVESQAGTIYTLSLIYETFNIDYDVTTINQKEHLTEMHVPDGKPDILQQIAHGAIGLVNGFHSLGRFYRGIICKDTRQYVLLGDASAMTDNVVFSQAGKNTLPAWLGNKDDDRYVFTEDNPRRDLQLCTALAAAARVLKMFDDTLAAQCLEISKALILSAQTDEYPVQKIQALAELILTTDDQFYIRQLTAMEDEVTKHFPDVGATVCRVLDRIESNTFHMGFMIAMQRYEIKLDQESKTNPFGLPYKPSTWGYSWNIERFGLEQYYLYTILQNEKFRDYFVRSLDYVLGVHPGRNTSSLVSGVGTKSVTVAYGSNRDDWSYIPGGVVSGTAYIKPDFPELKEWPYLWQQTEYMISGASENFMFLVLGMKSIF